MTPDLAGFSEWTLALLPRLFLVPGGLGLLVALLAITTALRGRAALAPRALLRSALWADFASTAIAWAAVSVMPFPGMAALPFPPDHLALTGVVAVSLAFYLAHIEGVAERTRAAMAGGAMVLANVVFAVAAGDGGLLNRGADGAWIQWGAAVAVSALALMSMPLPGGGAWALQALAWLALAVAPLWGVLDGVPAWQTLPSGVQAAFGGAMLVAGAIAVGAAARVLRRGEVALYAIPTAWLLGLLALLAHLLRTA